MSIITPENNSELGKYGIKEYDDENLSWEEFKEDRRFNWILKKDNKLKDLEIKIDEENGNYNLLVKNGIWKEGDWRDGIWRGGEWAYGLWRYGIWEYGTWANGTWVNGTWKDGTWKDGTWFTGTWEYGIWKGGTWRDGDWCDGIWENGTWLEGIWGNGVWLTGKMQIPVRREGFSNGIFGNIEMYKEIFNSLADLISFYNCIILNIELDENANYKDLKLQTTNSIILDEDFYKYSSMLSYRTKIK